MESESSSGWVARKLILVDRRSKTTFQLDAEIWKMIRPIYLAIKSVTAGEELTSDISVFSYSALTASRWDVDIMLIFPDKTELAEGRLRSDASAGGIGGGEIDFAAALPLVSSNIRKEVSVDRVATIRGISELAVWRMINTMTLKIYLIQESSRGGGSSHDDVVEVVEEAFCDDRSLIVFA